MTAYLDEILEKTIRDDSEIEIVDANDMGQGHRIKVSYEGTLYSINEHRRVQAHYSERTILEGGTGSNKPQVKDTIQAIKAD